MVNLFVVHGDCPGRPTAENFMTNARSQWPSAEVFALPADDPFEAEAIVVAEQPVYHVFFAEEISSTDGTPPAECSRSRLHEITLSSGMQCMDTVRRATEGRDLQSGVRADEVYNDWTEYPGP